MINKYNYRLETGLVGTNDDNIASVLYNINRMEMNAFPAFADAKEMEEALGELFFMIADAKVHMHRFLDNSVGETDTGTADAVTAALAGAIQIVRDAGSDRSSEAEMSAAFPKVYKMLLAIVPSVLALDAQANDRA